ncbi:MAG: copper chaperone PCu(A)C [Alphaproteobacteria bacterium]|nr:MAG: copper chaperone PCu(A)C [Alphaproteobacteria bacterium]
MKVRIALTYIMTLAGFIVLTGCSDSQPPQKPAHVVITDSWTKATAEGGKGVAYVTLVNEGTEPDRLISVAAQGAQMAEVHNHIQDGNVMRMISVPALEIPASGTLTFEPGGLHIMLMGLEKPLSAGDTLHITLQFQKTGLVGTEAKVLTMDEVLERAN